MQNAGIVDKSLGYRVTFQYGKCVIMADAYLSALGWNTYWRAICEIECSCHTHR